MQPVVEGDQDFTNEIWKSPLKSKLKCQSQDQKQNMPGFDKKVGTHH